MAKPGRPSPGLDDYLYWQERLASREASGLSIDEFCADEDISRSTFYRWVGRLKDGIPDAVKEEGASLTLADIAEPKFLPVSVTASPIEIELPNGGLVRLPLGVGQAVIVDVTRPRCARTRKDKGCYFLRLHQIKPVTHPHSNKAMLPGSGTLATRNPTAPYEVAGES